MLSADEARVRRRDALRRVASEYISNVFDATALRTTQHTLSDVLHEEEHSLADLKKQLEATRFSQQRLDSALERADARLRNVQFENASLENEAKELEQRICKSQSVLEHLREEQRSAAEEAKSVDGAILFIKQQSAHLELQNQMQQEVNAKLRLRKETSSETLASIHRQVAHLEQLLAQYAAVTTTIVPPSKH